MKRKLVISDIHGCFKEFVNLLEKVEYNSLEDQLLIIGDYVDRGPHSKEVVERLISLRDGHGAIVLKGNHDQRLVDLVRDGSSSITEKFLAHGGKATVLSYLDCDYDENEVDAAMVKEAIAAINKHYRHHIEFLNSLPYYEEDCNHIYVHAGINPEYPDWKRQPTHDFLYLKEPFLSKPTVVGKTVIFGHTRTKDIHGVPDIWFGNGKIGIDGGCAFGMQLNALEIGIDGQYRSYNIGK
ncbi:serine/threonine protein phosphatase [Paenibacillus sp. sptzw28]|uniref:metallophosphoesterase family protein n=1 Tax=Paenibacillus sp. sptzw28 TaxID=715179 RepID=UPI001C6F1FDC|nr:metallophosphoesterase family protein [Paenibacillus sp. sptzw28]QYR23518.1 serine/threonine protein phosphatase [Paenibacillus sp. sptzw28]